MDSNNLKLMDYVRTIIDGYIQDYGVRPSTSEYERVLEWTFRSCENFAFATARECVRLLVQSEEENNENGHEIRRLLNELG